MKFSTHADVEVPIDYVFDEVTNFTILEQSIMRVGGDVEKIVGDSAAVVGTRWRINFLLSGVERSVIAEIIEVDKPNVLTFKVTSKSTDASLLIELVALNHAHTRLNVTASAKAKTIAMKLLFQSFRFAWQENQTRFKFIVSNFAKELKNRHND